MGLLGTEYRPEHYFGKLRFFNNYNPLIMQEILDHKLDFVQKKTDADLFVLDMTDPAKRSYVADLNGFYFHILNDLGELISEGNRPIETLDRLKALHGLLHDEWYEDLITSTGIFNRCTLYKLEDETNEKKYLMARYEYIELDLIEGYTRGKIPGKYKPITEEYSRLKDYLLNMTFAGLIGIDTPTIPGLGFPNPWREAIENRFTENTMEHAKECFLNDQFKRAFKIIKEAPEVSPVPAIKIHSFGKTWKKMRMKDMEPVINADSVKGLYAKIYVGNWKRPYASHQLVRNEKIIGKKCLFQDTESDQVFIVKSDKDPLSIIRKIGRGKKAIK
jgi:hypothetical protein